MTEFAERLLSWFDDHGRKDLPWQREPNAYRIWVSEIMLQQTQVQTVIPYYERFIARFPDIANLAGAPIDNVLQHWSGLGYYARARNLHKAAQLVRDGHGGTFPTSIDEVLALPGIGRSTAGAILALAHHQHHAILDGNVKRVLARHEAIAGWPGKTSVSQALWNIAEHNTPSACIADYTQAIMDLGATVCTRSSPTCGRCPVQEDCRARLDNSIADYPGRKPKKDKPLRKTTMVLAISDNAIYLERRPPAGIWGGLWSLPEVDADAVDDWCRRELHEIGSSHERWDTLRHSFSHYDLDIQPVVVRAGRASRKVADSADATWSPLDGNPPGGMAAPVQKLISQLKSQKNVTNR